MIPLLQASSIRKGLAQVSFDLIDRFHVSLEKVSMSDRHTPVENIGIEATAAGEAA